MKRINKILSICLCLCMLFTHITPIKAIEPSTSDLDFHAFLSDYLHDNYLFDKIDDPMAHQFLHEAMTKEFGDTNVALTLVNIANDWGYPLKGKTGLYEQILLEMLVNHVNSDVFKKRVEEDKIKLENEVLSFLKKSFDFGYLADDHKELYSVLKKAEFNTWKELSKVPDEVFNKSIMELIEHNKIPISKSYKLNVAYNFIDLLTKSITYMSVCNQIDGIKDVLEEMVRYSDDSDMRNAVVKILNKLNSVNSVDLWNAIEANSLDFASDSIITFTKDMVMTCFGFVGLAIETSGFISNIVFKTDEIAKSYVLLKSEVEIENLIKKVIKVKQNTYMYKKEDAKVLNYSVMFLYDAYEYGIELTKKYGEKVLYVDYFLDLLNIDKDENNQYKEFISKVKTWEGIISNHRSLFESGWLEYKDLYLQNIGSLEEAFTEYVSGIYFDTSHITIDLEDAKTTYPLTGCKNMPNNISMTYTYTSSNPSIVSIENEHIYSIKAHQTGTVTITAKSEDGLYHTNQTITIVNQVPEASSTIKEGKDYSEFYQLNEDGITLTGVIKDCLVKRSDSNSYDYYMPSEIDGYTVTEVDLEPAYFEKDRKTIKTYILPQTCKRLVDLRYDGRSVDEQASNVARNDIILNEGLEEIGEQAFWGKGVYHTDLVLPSTIKKIGVGAFDHSNFNTIYINCPELKEIPKSCFAECPNTSIIFSNEMKQLKTIEEWAFNNTKYVLLPDCVEVLGKQALIKSKIDHYPDSLIEIGEGCFIDATVPDTLPSSVKRIESGAFSKNDLDYLTIPNSIEYLGQKPFEDIKNIFTYGDEISSNNGICEIWDSYSYFEMPYSITDIQYNLNSDTLVWTNGLNKIEDTLTAKYIYLREIDRNGTFSLNDLKFSNTVEMIEIPVNYLNNTKNTLNPYNRLKECIIVGDASENELKKYVEILKSQIQIGGSITHRDSKGNLTLLFESPLSYYVKESKSKYENQQDYLVEPIPSLSNRIQDTVRDIKVTLTSDEYAYQNITLQCWQDGNESLSERMHALGDYIIFEDVYLKQPYYRYFTIDVENESNEYVISLELDYKYFNKNNVGLYHINDLGKITRIPVNFTLTDDDSIITFKTDKLGQFALVRLENKETTIFSSYRDEYYYVHEDKVINKDTSADYNTNDGNQSLVGKDEDSNVIVVKPSFNINNEESNNTIASKPIKDAIKEEIIHEFELDDSIINKKEESVLITDENFNSLNQWEMIIDHGVILQTEKDEKIHIALNELDDKSYDFYVYKMNEDGSIEKVKNPIKEIKEKKVNPNILDSYQEYFELKLEEGKYFVTYLIGEENTSILSILLKGVMILLGILVLGFIGLVLFIIIGEKITKKRKRRKRK